MEKSKISDLIPVIKRLPSYSRLIYELYSSPLLTRQQKAVLGLGLAYAISPIDLVPGFLPIIGQLDDAIVALTALRRTLNNLDGDVRNNFLISAGVTLDDIEQDLKTSKDLSRLIVKTAVDYTGTGLKLAGRLTWKIASKATLMAVGGIASIITPKK